ncbi:MAG: DUF4082 domain-containing protein [Bacteroidota bacterium]|nr:DUF4082 domain-containing protein [Bacteroidota bacterium]
MDRIFDLRTYWKQLSSLVIAQSSMVLLMAQNPIVAENALPGNPSTEWDIAGAGDISIQGFATDISVNKGQTVHFKIQTDATAYTIDIYRLGYYNGNGARKQGTGTITCSLPQTQPSPVTDSVTGLVDCGNWTESGSWNVPSTAVPGIYIARLKRTDNGGASHIVFIVRDDTSHADLFFQASDATWQAYNVYGGNSLYTGATSMPGGHASKVSYNRPFLTRNGGGGGGVAQDWLFNAEYPMIRFLERNGYNISYTTDVDAARYGNLLLNHKVFLSVGHDEYWSAEQRANVEAARNAGVHLAFFSGNEVYWKTRWENSIDGSGTAWRTLVCYKEGTLGENVCGNKCDPTSAWTGLWRDGAAYDAGKPENGLTGQISWQNSSGSIQVPAVYKNLRFWRNTSIASLSDESIATLPDGTLGHEWDYEQYPDSYPSGRITLSSTTIGGYTHKLSLYRHPGGALVFGAGTIQWAWGLDDTHDRGNLPASQDMQQATVNLLADMGAQPGTLQAELVAATQSTDNQPPVTLITFPSNNASIPSFSPMTITGTCTDDHVVAGVEVSVDGGLTWKPANGTANWTFSWTPAIPGAVTIKVRGYDDSGNIEPIGTVPSPNAISVTIAAPQCPCTIYQLTDTPAVKNKYDNITGIEVGVKFRSKINGYITGLRFYKSSNDMGIHKGSLWTLGGLLLAQATFTNESATGWQEVAFSTPVAINANTTYVASYNSPTGYYAETNPYFTGDITNGPLTAIATTNADGPNGVFNYSPSPVFPSSNYQSNNYWVDIVFNNNSVDVVPPKVVTTSPANNSTGVNPATPLNVIFNEAIDPASITDSTLVLKNSGNTVIPSTITYNNGLHQATVIPVSPLDSSSSYSIIIDGGASGVKDLAGNPLPSSVSTTFRTTGSTLSVNEGPGGPILVISNSSNPFSTYPVEILRAEGLNEYDRLDITAVTSTILNNYDVVILGEMTVSAAQVTLLTNWVNAGGTLIALKPGSLLTPLLGISAASGTLSDEYLLVNTASGPGAGIVNQTIQFHGSANLHTLAGATSLATLYSTASTATSNPAVTTIDVGTNGGKAIAFTYDLARSVVYTRQGNPAWAGQKRDGQSGPIRSDDLFFGLPAGTGADWVDFNKIAIPQADEQQRLLANIILQSNLHRKPLPRFWYLPRGLKATIVMTGDDHANNGTTGRFNLYNHLSDSIGHNTTQDVTDWYAIRGTSYIYFNTPITNSQVVTFQNQGYEIALHPTTSCTDFTPASLDNAFVNLLGNFASNFPGAAAPVTNRTHCMPWSDWATHPKTEFNHGIRLDVNYYNWPASWVQNRPGVFTGSGMPMRFADTDGTLIDCYQAPTQMTDESGIGVGSFCDSLLNRALGPEGYYGVFTANMHTDTAIHIGSNAIIASALSKQIPVISAKQMLTWLDGRNNSSFGSISWAGNVLSFSVTAASGSNNLRAMLPYSSGTDLLTQITRAGSPIAFTISTIKGIQYAFFDASVSGNYTATYAPTTTITGQVALQGRPAAPGPQWQVPVQVEIYVTGNPTPITVFTATTNANGQFTVSGVPVGTYNIGVKNIHTLRRVMVGQALVAGGNNIDFGTLLEGDVNNDNFVTLSDLSLLINSFNKTTGDPGYDARADLNNDNFVTLSDLSILINNFNQAGEVNP